MSRLDRRVAVIALIALAAVTSCTAPAAPATSSPSATAAAAASPSPSPVATPRPTSAPWVTPSSGVEMAIEDPDLAINLPLSWRQVTEEEVEAQFAQYQAAGVDAATIERLRAQLSGTHAIATGYTPGGISIGISMIVMDDLGPGTDVVERYRERML